MAGKIIIILILLADLSIYFYVPKGVRKNSYNLKRWLPGKGIAAYYIWKN